MRGRMKRWSLVGLGWVAMAAGCRHGAVSSTTGEAQSSFRLIAPPPAVASPEAKASMSVSTRRQIFTDAMPVLPLAPPVYPTVARPAKLGVVTVAVHLTIDVSGRVREVVPSVAGFSIPNRFSAEFFRAVEEAVAQWRFTPAEFKQLEDAPGERGTSYLRVARQELIEAGCDVQFTFTDTGAIFSTRPAAK